MQDSIIIYNEEQNNSENIRLIKNKLGMYSNILDCVSYKDIKTIQNLYFDIAYVLGGDGTFLKVCDITRETERYINLIGINTGNRGFLTPFSINELEILELSLTKDPLFYHLNYLLMECGGGIYRAFNDIVIKSQNGYDACVLNVFNNGLLIDTFKNDGLIISTQLGSSGYSLSAGGPFISPTLNHVMCIVPICSHSLRQRPVIVDGNIEVHQEDKNTIYIDGKYEVFNSKQKLVINIQKSCVKVLFNKYESYWKRIEKKLT